MEGLSILIPTYNYCCMKLVRDLHEQALLINIPFEILVADDGSNDTITIKNNEVINSLSHCRYIRREQNTGRAAIRNFLVQQSAYSLLLFLDGDSKITHSDFLHNYLETDAPVVDGGVTLFLDKDLSNNLRYKYEFANKDRHTAIQRQSRPYQHFRTTNFIVSRDIMILHPFDERYRYYGYEDVAFGKVLQENNVDICHIDNPICMEGLEDNPDFVRKTEEGLQTLFRFKEELKDYSHMLSFLHQMSSMTIKCIQLFHQLFGGLERRNLTGRHPSLMIFKLYKLGYYLCYAKKQSSVTNP